MTTIKDRIKVITDKANTLEAENKAALAAAKKEGKKGETPHAPSVIYHLRRDAGILHLLNYCKCEKLIAEEKDVKVKEEMSSILAKLTDPAVGTVIKVKEGDAITSLLNQYKEVKDIAARLETACEKAGLKLDYGNNKVVKA